MQLLVSFKKSPMVGCSGSSDEKAPKILNILQSTLSIANTRAGKADDITEEKEKSPNPIDKLKYRLETVTSKDNPRRIRFITDIYKKHIYEFFLVK